ncbi:MAG TPA: hypothetical protein VFX37_10165 [Pseudolabrys sp.]|nr:hypothetical protein [Pseudolabrys sp.]
MNGTSGLATVLHAAGPAPDRVEKLDLYAWLIGDWDAEITTYSADGAPHHGEGEIHFGWVLEGRAIQDVWMIPRRNDSGPDPHSMPVAGNWYGTTLRIYDPAMDAWRIYWIDPATNSFRYQIGRRQGEDIVQEGTTESGAFSRWSFTEIANDSFRWLAESSTDGKAWRLVVEVRARRAST